jgi:hypothetical protein
MGRNFINRKRALRFTLMHRSQQDENNGSNYVLVPMNDYTAKQQALVIDDKSVLYIQDKHKKNTRTKNNEKTKREGFESQFQGLSDHPGSIIRDDSDISKLSHGIETMDPSSSSQVNNTEENEISASSNAGEAAKYGIFFDDREYDYMQHLRSMGHVDAVYIPAKCLGTQNDSKPWEESHYMKEAVLAADPAWKEERDDPNVQEVLGMLQKNDDHMECYEWPDNLVELLREYEEEEVDDKKIKSIIPDYEKYGLTILMQKVFRSLSEG